MEKIRTIPSKRILSSAISLVLCAGILPAFVYGLGPESHAGLGGSFIAAIPFGLCLWSCLSTESKPIWAKLILLVLLGVSFAFAFYVIGRYIAFGFSRR
jgi:VIT1/CCC1 family predicted Fe2+/Mn2+ transporter